ncbi:uncharacterized protein BDCG_08022 [Blastomyces dermatitidis ER-3]|uniref:Uncharacterized protein n=1 Tax=Ajellomyces dermatitidis (strain ER-3 / ATCC MYA-2586) TaxID=559297 RepID=A0ABP2EMZ0_AJEDR|nr:uncharacterized protein BDCG_08022 [Blastomyces dermatitidis ER-3]EEQ84753.2 hypothetical protein BDCG_08022 [Blastomyces dermatitidis ER-3]
MSIDAHRSYHETVNIPRKEHHTVSIFRGRLLIATVIISMLCTVKRLSIDAYENDPYAMGQYINDKDMVETIPNSASGWRITQRISPMVSTLPIDFQPSGRIAASRNRL